ncbi:hypothetical protein GDO81_001238 [Engystomops pustulosus]|uniref:Uncharacterized protein n=1 Tax=Engystomops pustulosus TaxID=76066 RepID=A0AAV7DAP4_ENGPU|nr:hypothetical protein GDO81_001238 [Engystomops pustulosus]
MGTFQQEVKYRDHQPKWLTLCVKLPLTPRSLVRKLFDCDVEGELTEKEVRVGRKGGRIIIKERTGRRKAVGEGEIAGRRRLPRKSRTVCKGSRRKEEWWGEA